MLLVDIPESERGQILREFPVKVPHGVTMFLKAGAVERMPHPRRLKLRPARCAVVRIEPMEPLD